MEQRQELLNAKLPAFRKEIFAMKSIVRAVIGARASKSANSRFPSLKGTS